MASPEDDALAAFELEVHIRTCQHPDLELVRSGDTRASIYRVTGVPLLVRFTSDLAGNRIIIMDVDGTELPQLSEATTERFKGQPTDPDTLKKVAAWMKILM